jgi:threonine dehydratase
VDITFKDIQEARSCLKNIAYKTGLVHNTTFSEMTGNFVYLKTENLQKTGSFKVRGAFNKIAHLPERQKKYKVIASSAGNHAQGTAMAATAYGIKSTIVMPKYAPLSKISATKSYGAKVVLYGEVYDEAYCR